jgi:hypothetical protein
MQSNAKNHRLRRRLAVLLLGTAAMAAGFLFGEVHASAAAKTPPQSASVSGISD